MEYKNYHATFHRNILNIYNSNNNLLSSRAYSNIIYENECEELFKASINSMDRQNINNII